MLLMIVFEVFVNILIIKLEYRYRAMELSLEKILGYSLWERTKSLSLITVGLTLLSTISGCLAMYFLSYGSVWIALFSGLGIGILDI